MSKEVEWTSDRPEFAFVFSFSVILFLSNEIVGFTTVIFTVSLLKVSPSPAVAVITAGPAFFDDAAGE